MPAIRICAAEDCSRSFTRPPRSPRIYCSATCRERVKAQRDFRRRHPGGPKRHADAPPDSSIDERFWVKVEKHGRCWIWVGSRDQNGYPLFWDSRTIRAHRWSFARWRGPIPTGMTLDHRCRQRACVNPRHLEVVTRVENIRRGQVARARLAS